METPQPHTTPCELHPSAECTWNQYSQLILSELRRLNDNLEKQQTALTDARMDVVKLKTQAGFIAAIVGVAVQVAMAVGKWLMERKP